MDYLLYDKTQARDQVQPFNPFYFTLVTSYVKCPYPQVKYYRTTLRDLACAMPGGRLLMSFLDYICEHYSAHAYEITQLLLQDLADDYNPSNDYQLNENIVSKCCLIFDEYFENNPKFPTKFK